MDHRIDESWSQDFETFASSSCPVWQHRTLGSGQLARMCWVVEKLVNKRGGLCVGTGLASWLSEAVLLCLEILNDF